MKYNWYGFDHKGVNKQFGGDLTYLTDLCINGEYKPVAVYRAKSPDKSKGHKKYMLLQISEQGGLVRGMTAKEIKPFRTQDAIECQHCWDVVYSVMRHDMRYCSCKRVAIDGAKDYTKVSGNSEDYVLGTLDLFTGKFTLTKGSSV